MDLVVKPHRQDHLLTNGFDHRLDADNQKSPSNSTEDHSPRKMELRASDSSAFTKVDALKMNVNNDDAAADRLLRDPRLLSLSEDFKKRFSQAMRPVSVNTTHPTLPLFGMPPMGFYTGHLMTSSGALPTSPPDLLKVPNPFATTNAGLAHLPISHQQMMNQNGRLPPFSPLPGANGHAANPWYFLDPRAPINPLYAQFPRLPLDALLRPPLTSGGHTIDSLLGGESGFSSRQPDAKGFSQYQTPVISKSKLERDLSPSNSDGNENSPRLDDLKREEEEQGDMSRIHRQEITHGHSNGTRDAVEDVSDEPSKKRIRTKEINVDEIEEEFEDEEEDEGDPDDEEDKGEGEEEKAEEVEITSHEHRSVTSSPLSPQLKPDTRHERHSSPTSSQPNTILNVTPPHAFPFPPKSLPNFPPDTLMTSYASTLGSLPFPLPSRYGEPATSSASLSAYAAAGLLPMGPMPFGMNGNSGILHPAFLGIPGGRRVSGDKPPPLKKYKCDICSKAFSRSNTLVTHKRIHTGEKPFKCEVCGRAFRQPGNLTRHRLTHTTVKPYVCAQCNKAFNRASNLHTHMRTHTSFKPFVCQYCGKGFHQKIDMKIHSYTHTGEKPHKCKTCGRGFKQLTHLTYHMRTHSDRKMYQCPTCGKGFNQKGNLQAHIYGHTGERPHRCEVCGKGFTLASTLNTHRRIHADNKPFSCQHCGKDFYQKNALKSHLIASHPYTGQALL
ncbi:zinc finger protein 768 isoform X3 [Lingula anatina]|nr:zinc finger protein 768 isoform X3 [Lingula anatina]XP_013418380.1 zinc finger protein 768 isoform X3 [Lingula anatina]XP_013418381.1 zinc finger protein 768 isoform X3 [Lingula anatina]XP_013418382.1 zinc finger protein 768 isoform X3 [Lingula anatina]XP_013418383.1 zinc finger protein 768 isoform X3 [Lingula anatina]XP_013418384.1 zinc finger protein 768 isoform X3 [Lingula anatina]XP_013418385.1 zinc finger protein 768 isoform X3 [Lingula anatina]|eukprot:XP_013418379.1 zinc finger protein 768 isoform X3 [Lingula anatina]